MSLIYLIDAARRAFAAWRREQAYADLMALDDHVLADIGLHRSEVVAALYGTTCPADTTPARLLSRQSIARHERSTVASGCFPLF